MKKALLFVTLFSLPSPQGLPISHGTGTDPATNSLEKNRRENTAGGVLEPAVSFGNCERWPPGCREPAIGCGGVFVHGDL